MNQPVNQLLSGTCTGTAIVLLVQVNNTEILKTILPAAIGAVASYLVWLLLKKLQKYLIRKK